YIYEFEVTNRAGTYWYHPHPHEQTGAQVYYGLAGLFIIEDEVEQSYALPHGQYDLPIVIQDRSFKPDKQLQYVDNPHQIMVGFLADTLLVNGRFDHVQAVDSHPYRLRLLNGSNARIYKLAWEDGSPITVIGTDGGLLEAPVNREYIMLAPAERLEVWVDFSGRENGFSKSLRALPIEGGNRQTVEVVRFEVTQQVHSDLTLPSSFDLLAFHNPGDAVNSAEPRQFDFFVNHMTPTIDGRRFELDKADPHETVKLNTLEIWELTNDVNGSTGFPHPIHIHGVQFQILERTVMAEAQPLWETVKDGYVDEGWKDTVLLMPGERVKVLLKFEDHTGLFLYHCHNLEHEDGGMIRNYRVEV
ncbi:MAG: multicopper oxidase domain-containing protein, partial [Anaerolineales bacterium]|nr:multicopper oxidase domain-containing protein [Anaerolineales bacterium]